MDRNQERSTPRLIFGLVILTLGVLFTLDRLDLIDAGHYWDYWPLILVAAGLAKLLEVPATAGRAWGLVLVGGGVWLLLYNLGVVDVSPFRLWPLVLVLIGGSLIWRAVAVRRDARAIAGPGEFAGASPLPAAPPEIATDPPPAAPPDSGETHIHAVAVLGGVERRVSSRDFRGGDLTAVMGGCEVDLRSAGIASGEAVIDVFAMWGGIEIHVPANWTVVLRGTPIIGGFEDKTRPPAGGARQVLIVRGMAIMGGVEITN